MKYLLIFTGGGAGSVLRFVFSRFVQQNYPSQFPVATLSVNLLSSFLLGLLVVALADKNFSADHYWLLLAVGLCGGLSTFSAFTLDLYHLMKAGMLLFAVINAIVSVLACTGALWVGTMMIKK